MSVRVLTGDCRVALATLADESVNCIVTSPPYYGLRDYGADGQIGLERTPDEFVAELVGVFRECRRALRADGVLWVNIGDSYARAHGKGQHKPGDSGKQNYIIEGGGGRAASQCVPSGCKPKDLIGIPWMLAFALRADGWWLRGDHVWGKPNGMPESTEDRPTRGHEYVFLLSKSQRYWYDAEAVRTAPKASTITRLKQNVEEQAGSERANGGSKTNGPMKAVGRRLTGGAYAPPGMSPHANARRSDKQRGHSRRHDGFNDRWDDAMERDEQMADGANLRSVWWVPPAQYGGEHYAVMPDLVAEICIRAGCPEGGTVLDPFGGVGTTGLVADRLGRNAVLIELHPKNADAARERIHGDAPLFTEVA